MSKMIQLPQGQWVDPNRVSSIEARSPDHRPPIVVVTTQDGVEIELDYFEDLKKANKSRDDIATQVNQARDETTP
jgi:hypothetical protein